MESGEESVCACGVAGWDYGWTWTDDHEGARAQYEAGGYDSVRPCYDAYEKEHAVSAAKWNTMMEIRAKALAEREKRRLEREMERQKRDAERDAKWAADKRKRDQLMARRWAELAARRNSPWAGQSKIKLKIKQSMTATASGNLTVTLVSYKNNGTCAIIPVYYDIFIKYSICEGNKSIEQITATFTVINKATIESAFAAIPYQVYINGVEKYKDVVPSLAFKYDAKQVNKVDYYFDNFDCGKNGAIEITGRVNNYHKDYIAGKISLTCII